MTRFRIFAAFLVLSAAAAAAFAQQGKPAPAPGFDSDACAKHCKEMGAAKQKMMDEHKAMIEKHDAAWKEIHAKLDDAKKARGEKKVAALEAVIEQLVSFHESMMSKMHGGMACCEGMDHPMGHGAMPCCGEMGHPMGGMHGQMGGMMDCCAGQKPMGTDCPMMSKD